MEFSQIDLSVLDEVPWFQIFIAFTSASAIVAFFYYSLTYKDESAVPFRLPLPEQCDPSWEGEELKEATIKVVILRAQFEDSQP
jgi:hypothetical protein